MKTFIYRALINKSHVIHVITESRDEITLRAEVELEIGPTNRITEWGCTEIAANQKAFLVSVLPPPRVYHPEHRDQVYAELDRERDYQDQKWGADRKHEVGAWIAIVEEYLDLARKAWAHSRSDDAALHELRKGATVLIACFEEHGVPAREEPVPE